MFRKITRWYASLLSWLLVASVAILVIPVSLQIFSRYTALIPSYIWTEEMARFCFIWSIMLGAMIGIREGTHFVVDLWPPLNPRAQAVIRLVASVFVLIFALVFFVAQIEANYDRTRLNIVESQIIALERDRQRRRLSPFEADVLRSLYDERNWLRCKLKLDRC